ncbi:hypothetical protein L211DRAFT_532194 [Terfezia boudieri ATCC MYA-4762]|uniref:Uncharacterized protein n=1 Tax=Terfezia boudieri ATCC MYA-4762 TaxID=1051890 RepID=A0A3N4LC39_9PEZI|nr:hypothetical protein L211DRAFT_532194 [Terfezia boudieri ATCC MYA-4762]
MATSSYQSLLLQLPSPSPLPSVVGISEFLYYPISKLDFGYNQYHAITEAFFGAVGILWKSATTMQLWILVIMALSLVYTMHNGRRFKRIGRRRLRRKTSFKVEELYEDNVLVEVADILRREPNTDVRSPLPDGLVRREKMVHAEEPAGEQEQSHWGRRVKTRMLLMARPPVGLLR